MLALFCSTRNIISVQVFHCLTTHEYSVWLVVQLVLHHTYCTFSSGRKCIPLSDDSGSVRRVVSKTGVRILWRVYLL